MAFAQDALGISQTIPANDISPKLSPDDAIRAARNYAPADEPGSIFGNYSSYTEFSDEADTEHASWAICLWRLQRANCKSVVSS